MKLSILRDNWRMLAKLLVVVTLMFGFSYALVPMYRAICEALGINVLTLSEQRASSGSWSGRKPEATNTQVEKVRVWWPGEAQPVEIASPAPRRVLPVTR